MTAEITLREVRDADLPIIFTQQLDPAANHMAAFTARDPSDHEAFMAHWAKILADPAITKRTILYNGEVVGNIGCFPLDGQLEIGYWIGPEYWGKGIATAALQRFLGIIEERPLYAHVAHDNLASMRVLEKCGFTLQDYGRGFANARGEEIEEAILELS